MTKSGMASVPGVCKVSTFRGSSLCSSLLNLFAYREPLFMGISKFSLIRSRQA